jgi:hypothetical protein
MPSKPPALRRVAGGVAILALWAVLLVGGFRGLLQYETTSTPFRPAPSTDDRFPAAGKPSLIIALHPKCPCSRASVAELVKIYSHATNQFKITVLAYKPSSEPNSWVESDSLRSIRDLNPEIIIDRDGAEASRLGMTTSGQVIVYDRSGHLVFNGGITGSRGHQGDNVGEQTVLAEINGVRDGRNSSAPVFGCSIFDRSP